MNNFEISFDNFKPKIKRLVSIAKQDTSNHIIKNNYYLFMQFLDGVKPQGEIIQSEITGKSLSISINYEFNHFKEILSLIQLITNHGAIYKLKASNNDIFVTYPMIYETGNERFCTRLKYVNEAIEKGKQIKIINFKRLLEILHIQEEMLLEIPFPKESSFYKRQETKVKVKSDELKKEQKTDTATIGEFFRAQGIDLNSLINKS